MRRLAAVATIALVLNLTLVASATSSEHYKDRFTSIGWGGSDGSLHWSGAWSEVNDDDDEKKGSVRVVSSGHCASGNCMRIAGGLALLADIGARRSADTSELEDLRLEYDLRNVTSLLPLGLTELRVQVRGDGAWVTVGEHNLGDAFTGHFTHDDLDDFRSEDFRVRFLVSGTAMTSEVFIDNVEVGGVWVDASTTTTSTTPSTSSTTTSTTTTSSTTTTTAPGASTTPSNPSTTSTTRPGGANTTTTTTGGSPSSTSSTTTSTAPATATRDQGGPPSTTGTSTTTSTPTSTTSSGQVVTATDDGGGGGTGGQSEGSGIRAAARGLQADFQGDLFGEVRTVSSLGGVDLQADYRNAVEVIRSSWAWMALLGLMTAWAIVSRLDRTRADLDI